MGAKAKVDPVAAMAASAVAALGELGVKAGGSSWRIPCAYGACSKEFLPHGTGSWIHSSCPVGSLFFGPFSKATREGDTGTAEAILAKAKAIANS